MMFSAHRGACVLFLACLIAAAATGSAYAAGTDQPGGAASAAGGAAQQPAAPWLFVGGRIGVAYEYAPPSDFNALIQPFFPSANSYFPVYSTLGLSITERFPIGNSSYHLALTEMPTVSGIDQNYAMPRLTLLVGLQTSFGLEVGLGPQIEPVVAPSGQGVNAAPSLVASVGWRFTMGRISFPVSLLIDPLPPHRYPRATLLSGIDFGFDPSLPKKPPAPFNY